MAVGRAFKYIVAPVNGLDRRHIFAFRTRKIIQGVQPALGAKARHHVLGDRALIEAVRALPGDPPERRRELGLTMHRPGPGRLENRAVDGAANPYLSCAAMLAAGLDGIENKIDPGARNDDNLYEIPEAELRLRGVDFLPTTLAEALDHLEQDDVVKSALGPQYAPYYVDVKRDEWRRYNQSVSQWESDTYLPVY